MPYPEAKCGNAEAHIRQYEQCPKRSGETASRSVETIQELILTRCHTSPRRLVSPGPTSEQTDTLFTLAAFAPDHGLLVPWRFVIIPTGQRQQLAEAFALALAQRDSAATEKQMNDAREKAYRSPFLAIAIARHEQCKPDIPIPERMISMGAAIQNMLIGSNAMGLGSALTSGRAMSSQPLRQLLDLQGHEHAICCINIGTIERVKARSRRHPSLSEFVGVLGESPTMTAARSGL